MNEIKVLIVDDQRLVREGIASLLEIQEGLTITGTAENGRAGVQMAMEMHPDIVLMDIRMPVQDGIASVEKLLEKGFGGKVMMLTTFDDEQYIMKSLQAGAVGYLMKDIPADDLARSIRQAYHGIFQLAECIMGSLMGTLKKGNAPGNALPGIPESQLEMISRLSDREKEVFRAIGRGYTNKEIADSLYLSEGTIKNYVSAIFNALGLRDRVQAALIAYQWEELESESKEL